MKRKMFVLGLLGLLCLFAAGWFLGYLAMSKQSVQAQSSDKQTVEAQPADKQAAAAQPTPYVPTPPSIKGIDAALLKARWGLEFTPAEPSVQPKITKEQALSKAYEGRIKPGVATSVVYELGYLRNPAMIEATRQGDKVFPQMADPGLVWILVFEGVPSVSSGPAQIPGGPPIVRGHSNEVNVVISATTGEYIESIIYR